MGQWDLVSVRFMIGANGEGLNQCNNLGCMIKVIMIYYGACHLHHASYMNANAGNQRTNLPPRGLRVDSVEYSGSFNRANLITAVHKLIQALGWLMFIMKGKPWHVC